MPEPPSERPTTSAYGPQPAGDETLPPSSLPALAAGDDAPPCDFGRYRLQRVLGSGAMGAVYRAHDLQLDRVVALKVPLTAGRHGTDSRARFEREARAAATLRHPNLCPVYDVGEVGGIPYLTMAYIDGRPLSDRLVPGGWPNMRAAAELVRTLALALGEAHRQGVSHRDLKPSNVMIDAAGVPVVTDFGLARRDTGGDVRQTVDGQIFGTPAYMAPEQARGQAAALGPACDIYSLGVILYELLTGELPFRGATPMEVMIQVLMDDPRPAEALRPGLDPRLAAVCRRAMAKDPADRFASMEEFGAALTAAFDRPRLASRAKKWLVAAAGAMACGTLACLVATRPTPPMPNPVETAPPAPENREVTAAAPPAAAPPAAAPPAATRPWIDTVAVYSAIDDYLQNLPAPKQKTTRFFSLAHLHNNSSITDDDLRLYRAAFSIALNSVSWDTKVVVPRGLALHDALFAVDVSELGWDPIQTWRAVLKAYPYGLTYDGLPNATLRILNQRVVNATGVKVPVIRADWFVGAALRPPLYNDLLFARPGAAHAVRDVDQLERALGVEFLNAIFRDQLVRTYLEKNSVTRGPTVVERREGNFGAYWRTYDFWNENDPMGDPLSLPLGPDVRGNNYRKLAFVHAGSQVSFSLPNGSTGFFLADAAGKRLDELPKFALGGPNVSGVLTGLSCIGCHGDGPGVATARSRVAANEPTAAASPEFAAKVRRIYPGRGVLARFAQGVDNERFRYAVGRATQAFLRPTDKGSAGELIRRQVDRYNRPLDVAAVAAELGIDDPKRLGELARQNVRLQGFGIVSVVDGGTISRERWIGPSGAGRITIYQYVAAELDQGISHIEL